jgi:putative acetyltransferase
LCLVAGIGRIGLRRVMIDIRHAQFPKDMAAVLDIWREYVVSPSVSLDYQDNEAEFASLPGPYARPDGRLLLAERSGQVVGCIALRRVSRQICEMKRLYVRPSVRDLGVGRRLVQRLIAEAQSAGYVEMRLDVLPEFKAAQRLYAELGFAPAAQVAHNPIAGALFLGLLL